MLRVYEQLSMAFLASLMPVIAVAQGSRELSTLQLEQRLKEIDERRARLATYSLGSGIGAIGYRSHSHDTAENPEWIEIDFGKSVPLDEVILVPAIRRDSLNGFQADGFPEELRIIAGTDGDKEGKVIAEFWKEDQILPRIAPLVVPCSGANASWIRVEARTLSQRAFDGKFVLQLSEVLAFSSGDNVALHKPVKSSSGDKPVIAPGWDDAYVVDGFLPYLMAAADGGSSVAYLNPLPKPDHIAVTIDLGAEFPTTGIRLHAVDQSDTVPQAFAGDFGIPEQTRIEGANNPDFSDARTLIELRHVTIYDVGPIMTWNFPETRCRYVRLQVVQPNANPLYGDLADRFGLAEVEVLSGGKNVALRKPVTASFKSNDPSRPLANLTDGLNYYGAILPMREWLEQLARRHELERERPLVRDELNKRYAHQKATLKKLTWLAVALAFGVIVVVLVDRIMRRRAIGRMRNRIAADLHDELGADLHAIGLLSDLADGARSTPDKLGDYLHRLRSMTERAGKAARHCTNLIEAKELYGGLAEDMRRTADRILADLAHEIEFEGEDRLHKIGARRRIDLLLFYQECLVNIIRHSGATHAKTRILASDREINLFVSDDGRGLQGGVPSSLKRRARLMGGRVEAISKELNGVCIHLRLRTNWFGV